MTTHAARRLAATAFSLVLFASGVEAATFVVPSDRALVARADAIIVATALNSRAQFTPAGGIETVTTMLVSRRIKGLVADTFDVYEPGGAIGDVSMTIPGAPQFTPGEDLLLFLKKSGENRWSAADLIVGKFSFRRNTDDVSVLVRDEDELRGWDPDLKPHVERQRAADGFLTFVNETALGRPANGDYFVAKRPLKDEPRRRVQINTVAATTTSTTASPAAVAAPSVAPYTAASYTMIVSSTLGSRWTVFPSAVTWYTGTTQEPGAPGGGTTAVTTGIASWNNDCPSNVNYVYGGTDNGSHTQGLHAADGANTVLFERDLSAWGVSPFTCSSSGYSGTLGLGGVTNAQGTHTLGTETFYTTQEADVEMNKGLANCTLLFNNGDFNSAVTHELGHTLGFRHSDQNRAGSAACTTDTSLECSSSAIMTAFVTTGLNATLQAWDQHAVQALYPATCGGSTSTKGDFNRDGRSDLVWRNQATGQNAVWYLNGAAVVSAAYFSPITDAAWIIATAGDFNGDGFPDLLLRNTSTGANAIWFMHNNTTVGSDYTNSVADPNWVVGGSGDVNRDGRDDILWRNRATGQNAVWYMSGASVIGSAYLPSIDVRWTMAGLADMNGDGNPDVIWRNTSSGVNAIWYLAGTTVTSGAYMASLTDLSWTIAALGDFNGDGHADILWRNTSGTNAIWFMNNTATLSGAYLPALDTNWTAGGPR